MKPDINHVPKIYLGADENGGSDRAGQTAI
jgi:hypothetical protein